MAQSVRDTKKRIRSVKNIAQITRAMEAVSANKMRRSQQRAIEARPYAVAALELMDNLLLRTEKLPAFFRPRPVKTILLLVVTSDKGLAGAYNGNVFKAVERQTQKFGGNFKIMAVGKTARRHFAARRQEIIQSFLGLGDLSKLEESRPLFQKITDGFQAGEWDEVWAIYTCFRTTLKQEVVSRKILPITREGIAEMVLGILPEHGRYAPKHQPQLGARPGYRFQYLFEPSAEFILERLVSKLLAVHLHHLLLEANASEHSARMLAMKNASDNAGELLGDLSLIYNKMRQAAITREIIEITSGSEALSR